MAGGGVGEAMLIGAAVGAASGGAGAAIQGGDPLQGALIGGATGAVGGGITTALTPTAAALPTASSVGIGATGATNTGIGSLYTGAAPGATTATSTGSIFSGAAPGVNTATNLGSSIASGGSGTAGGGIGALSPGAAPVVSTAPISSGLDTAGAGGASNAVAPTVQASGGNTQPSLMDLFRAAPTPNTTQDPNNAKTAQNIFGQTLGEPGVMSNKSLGMTAASSALAGASGAKPKPFDVPEDEYDGPLSKLKYDPDKFTASAPTYAPVSVYRPTYAAEGGIMQAFQAGGPVERMSQMNTAMNPQGGLYPQGMIDKTQYAIPTQRPTSMEVLDVGAQRMFASGGIARYAPGGMVNPAMGMATQQATPQRQEQGIDSLMSNKKRMLTKEQLDAIAMQGMSEGAMKDVYGQMEAQGLAKGGHLGGYSDGGRMLKGPGDGMSDNIPATIAGKQPARLADGEFVVPADVVSHLGNGSTDAGAKQLYAMMNRVRKARTGNPKQGKQIKPAKYMAA